MNLEDNCSLMTGRWILATGVWTLSAGRVSIPYSPGKNCKKNSFKKRRPDHDHVSIPYSSGKNCKDYRV